MEPSSTIVKTHSSKPITDKQHAIESKHKQNTEKKLKSNYRNTFSTYFAPDAVPSVYAGDSLGE